MHRICRLLVLACLLCAGAAAIAGCSLTSVSSGQGPKSVDVTMGGHVMTDTTLDFKAVGYAAGQLQIENTASSQSLDIGLGTPITSGDGTLAAKVVGAISIPPGKVGALVLDRQLSPGMEYYLGANSSGPPSIRQMFLCPGDGMP
jgi:hypothetical protein